jgi:hypothetical protein
VRRTYCVTVPRGVYKLEAQDDEYYYYALSGLMSRSIYDGKKLVESNNFCGGLMIARDNGVTFPAGVYRSDGSMNRTMIWRFGDEFGARNGEGWEESEGR